MNDDKRQIKRRSVNLLKKTGLVVLVGLLYYLFIRITGYGIPCIFHVITGKYCPGCGITRMFVALFSGDIVSAVRYNLLVMILIVLGAVPIAVYTIRYIKTGKTDMNKAEQIGVMIVFVITIAFWIMRNTEYFSWLAPTA